MLRYVNTSTSTFEVILNFTLCSGNKSINLSHMPLFSFKY